LQNEPNEGRFNGATNNCADFAAELLNTIFPRSARADHLNDFLMTSPKAIAKSLTHYALRHPELGLRVVRYTQSPGEYPASHDNRKGTEQLWRANKWRIPLAVVLPEALAAAGVSYATSGRFNPEREMQLYPSSEIVELEARLNSARARGELETEQKLRGQLKAARTRALGTDEEWAEYQQRVAEYEAEYASGVLESEPTTGSHPMESAVRQRLAQSWMSLDEHGGLWLRPRSGQAPVCGLSASTVAAGGSDTRQAYLVALARVESELHRKKKNRETIGYFREDWALVERLRAELAPVLGVAKDSRGTQSVAGNYAGR